MAVVKVFKERDNGKYGKHTFKSELEHLDYLMNEYVIKEEKVVSKATCGVRCNDNPQIAYEEFISTKQQFNKYDPGNERSREFKHYTISFNHEESEKLNADLINNMCKEIIERVPEFNNYQVSIATHEDKKHIHAHIIVNSVNMVDGYKIQLTKDFLTKFQYICNEYTSEHNLSTHKLPYELKLGDKNVSFNRIDYNAHKNGTMSNTELFARRIENIIKNTNNRYELFKAMKDNNYTMRWSDDKKYNDKLWIGKITITDNKTGEKHRLEKLYKTYNLDVSRNKDLINHFKEIEKINELKKEYIIKGIKVNKDDLIRVNNEEDIKKIFREIKESLNGKDKITNYHFYSLNDELKNKILELANNLYTNSPDLKQRVMEKTKELLIKAKDENKNLNFEQEEKNIERKLLLIMANKILKEALNNKQSQITENTVNFLIKSIGKCIKQASREHINNADSINKKNDLEKEKAKKKDIEKAIIY